MLSINEYTRRFFEIAEDLGYKIEPCQAGSSKGKKQVVFKHKKLHADHLRKLYPLVVSKGSEVPYEDFKRIVPGRPCAHKPFDKINRIIFA